MHEESADMVIALRAMHPRALWAGYNEALQQKPISTKALTCMAGFAIGDGIAQLTTQKRGGFVQRLGNMDGYRTAKMAMFGLVWSGPVGHYWYNLLDKIVMPASPKHPAAVVGKVALDQLVYSPIGTAIFFAWNNVMSFTPHNILPDIHAKLWPSMLACWTLWPVAMTINMAFVPPHLRIAYINVISLAWTNILSRMASEQKTPEAETLFLPTEGVYRDAVIDPLLGSVEGVLPMKPMTEALEPMTERLETWAETVREAVVDPVLESDVLSALADTTAIVVDALPLDTTPPPERGVEITPMAAFPGVGAVTPSDLAVATE